MSEENSSGIADILALLTTDEKEEKKEETSSSESPLDLDMILKLGSVFSELSQEDPRSRLLNDLKPFLSDGKKGKIDQAVQLLKLAKVAEKLGDGKLL